MTSITDIKKVLGITEDKAEVWTVVSTANGQTKLQLGQRTLTVNGIYQGKVVVINGNIINTLAESNTTYHIQ